MGQVISQVTVGGEDHVLRQITIQPGGTTGWHWHDGTLYAYVEHGTLTHTDADCTTTDVYRQGAAFIEPSGADHVHVGRNLGTAPLVLDVLYVDPAGSPLSRTHRTRGAASDGRDDAPAPHRKSTEITIRPSRGHRRD